MSFHKPVPIGNLQEGEVQAVTGMLEKDAAVVRMHGLLMTSVYLKDISGRLRITWFNAPFLRNTLRAGSMFVFMGKVGSYNGQKTMNQPKIFSPEAYEKKVDTLEPVYSQVKGLTNASIMKAVSQAIEVAEYKTDFVPAAIRYNRNLMEMKEAVAHVHFPETIEDFEKARGRLAYNELFLFSLALVKKKQNTEDLKSCFKLTPDKRVDDFIKKLPFSLTNGQSESLFRNDHEQTSSGRCRFRKDYSFLCGLS